MGMVPAGDKITDLAEQSLEFFDLVASQKKTAKQLANETGLSLKTVYNRINKGREAYEAQLREMSSKLIADVSKKYEYLWNEAKEQWENTKNSDFLKIMQSIVADTRKMHSLDNAAKAPVNQDGTDHNETLVLVFNDEAYKAKETEYEQKVVDGTYTIQPQIESKDSTSVPLSPDGEVV